MKNTSLGHEDRDFLQPDTRAELQCLGSVLWGGFLFGGGGRFSHFSLLRVLSHEDGDIDEEDLLVRCSSNPQKQNQVHYCQFELN